MGEIGDIRKKIQNAEKITPDKLNEKNVNRGDIEKYLKRQRAEIDRLSGLVTAKTEEYYKNTNGRNPEREFKPKKQKGAECVPTAIHESLTRILGDKWTSKFGNVNAVIEKYKDVCKGNWQNPTLIYGFIKSLADEGFAVGARYCHDPLTLTAGLEAGGMAVAKIQDKWHVQIIEDWGKDDEGLFYVIGDTLHGFGSKGSVNKHVSLEKLYKSFFRQDEMYSVVVIVPLEQK